MEYTELIRIILRRWWLIVLPVVLTAVIAIPELVSESGRSSGGFATEIRYSAAQKFNLPERDGDYTDVWLASEHTVDALTDWARTSSFRAEVHNQLADADVSLEALQVAADNVRNVGVIYLNHSNRESLGAIADAALLVLSNRSQTYFPQLGGEAAQVTILEQPAITATPPSIVTRLAPFIRLAVALFIGLAIAIFAECIDPTIYHQNDLRRLGMPLLGSIPGERV